MKQDSHSDSVTRDVVIADTPDRVFRSLTQDFGTWFRVKLDGAFREGGLVSGEMTMPGAEGLPFKARTLTIDPPRTFVFEWPQWDFEANRSLEDSVPWTRVSFDLEAVAEGTRVTVTESGFAGLPPGIGQRVLRENTEGWELQLRSLADHVAA
jgi:uncharacterized protein YndB with AHSA1/START domain